MLSTAARIRFPISHLIGRLGPERLMRNLAWYGLAEGVARISRLIATVLLARMMTSLELGLAATAITCFELVRVLGNNGMGELVMRASHEKLAATCETVYRLGWVLCLAKVAVSVLEAPEKKRLNSIAGKCANRSCKSKRSWKTCAPSVNSAVPLVKNNRYPPSPSSATPTPGKVVYSTL